MLGRLLPLALIVAACAGTPDNPAPDRSLAWGYLQLVPREGVTPGGHASASYGDRRMRDVSFVDYSTPGFAVVYVEGGPAPAGEARIAIETTRVATAFAPAHAVVGAGGTIAVVNRSDREHVLSVPAAGLVARLAPGESRSVAVSRPGEQGLFLLDVPEATATVFASPGAYAVVSSTGRFELGDLEPGAHELRAWHPRFPPAGRRVVLEPGAALRVDLEIGVGRSDAAEPVHAH